MKSKLLILILTTLLSINLISCNTNKSIEHKEDGAISKKTESDDNGIEKDSDLNNFSDAVFYDDNGNLVDEDGNIVKENASNADSSSSSDDFLTQIEDSFKNNISDVSNIDIDTSNIDSGVIIINLTLNQSSNQEDEKNECENIITSKSDLLLDNDIQNIQVAFYENSNRIRVHTFEKQGTEYLWYGYW